VILLTSNGFASSASRYEFHASLRPPLSSAKFRHVDDGDDCCELAAEPSNDGEGRCVRGVL